MPTSWSADWFVAMCQSLCHPNEPVLTRFPIRYDIVLDGPMSTLLQKRNPRAASRSRRIYRRDCSGLVSACGSRVLAERPEQGPHGLRFAALRTSGLRLFVPCVKIEMQPGEIGGDKTLQKQGGNNRASERFR